MNPPTPDRQTVRRYLLGTLPPRRHAQVEALAAQSQAWREAVEAEREALRALDALPAPKPSPDLHGATMARIRAEAGQQPSPKPREPQPMFSFVGVAAILCCTAIIAAVLMPALARSREAASRSSCQNNLKQMGLVFKMYANEAPGALFPPPALDDGVLAPKANAIWPEYLTDPNVLLCPRSGCRDAYARALDAGAPQARQQAFGMSYTYLGYAVTSLEELELLVKGLAQRPPGAPFDDITVDGHTIFRLGEHIPDEHSFNLGRPGLKPPTNSDIPVMWDNLAVDRKDFNHVPAGCNVLYLDGHVEFIKYPGAFPVQEGVYEALEKLKALADRPAPKPDTGSSPLAEP